MRLTEYQKTEMQQLLADFDCARTISEKNLKALLRDNCNTEFGMKHHFSSIRSLADYRREVPLSCYDDYAEDFARIFNGEENILFSYDVRYRIMTSGSTNLKKRTVLTNEALRRYSCYTFFMPYVILPEEGPGACFFSGFFYRPKPEETTVLSSAFHYSLYRRRIIQDDFFVGGGDSVFTGEIKDILYFKCRLALATEDIHDILSVFLYDLIRFFQYLEENSALLLEDLSTNTINPAIKLPQKQREILEKLPPVSAERLQLLREEFAKGFDGIVRRIWKNVRFVNGIGGKGFESQEAEIRRYIGDLPIVYFSYAASECLLAVPLAPDSYEYALLPRSAFYEFLDLSTGSCCTIDEVEVGKEYELVLSTFTGLYRYRLGDVVRICGFRGETPIIRVVGRNMVINKAGEKVDVSMLKRLVGEIMAQNGKGTPEFSFGVDLTVHPARYCVFYEDTDNDSSEMMADRLDILLRSSNTDYDDLRRLGTFDPMMLYAVEKGSHISCVYETSGLSHKKPITCLKDEQVAFMKGCALK